jgi:hypothetical protein
LAINTVHFPHLRKLFEVDNFEICRLPSNVWVCRNKMIRYFIAPRFTFPFAIKFEVKQGHTVLICRSAPWKHVVRRLSLSLSIDFQTN